MRHSTDDILQQFRAALEERGIAPPAKIIADGKWHRCDAIGRKGLRGGAYRLHLNGFPAGCIQNHHDNLGAQNWKADIEDTRTPEEKARDARDYEENKRRAIADRQQSQLQAKSRATWILEHSEEATSDHVYSTKKGIPNFGLTIYKGSLVVPMHDIEGDLHSLQFIKEDGTKSFLKDGLVEGCFYGLGEPGEILYVVEGLATAGTVHICTGAGVAVAFNSGNLLSVGLALRKKYPTKRIVYCSDDDALNVLRDVKQELDFFYEESDSKRPARYLTNAGLMSAYKAARATNGTVAVPVFPEADASCMVGSKFRGTAFRPLAARASFDAATRLYRPGVLPAVDRYVTEHVKLAQYPDLVWGTIITHMKRAGLLADETDFNDLQIQAGMAAVKSCLDRPQPAPAEEVQELSFHIVI